MNKSDWMKEQEIKEKMKSQPEFEKLKKRLREGETVLNLNIAEDIKKVNEVIKELKSKEKQHEFERLKEQLKRQLSENDVVDDDILELEEHINSEFEEKRLKTPLEKLEEVGFKGVKITPTAITIFKKVDPVDDVFYNHPVYVRLREQIDKGLIKYNTPVQPDHYSIFGWFNHKQQENTDKIVYNEIIKMKLEEVIKLLKTADDDLENGWDSFAREKIKDALNVLEGHKEGNE